MPEHPSGIGSVVNVVTWLGSNVRGTGLLGCAVVRLIPEHLLDLDLCVG